MTLTAAEPGVTAPGPGRSGLGQRWGPAVAVGVLLLAVAGRYGYHRDELYFRVAGDHLALGYVDQPPLAPALTRLARLLFGDSVVALRIIPALVAGAVVAVTAGMTGRLGGDRRAQLLAGTAIGISPIVLAGGHLAGTTVYDLLTSALVEAVLLRILSGDERTRTWLLLGAVLGVGLWAKYLSLFVVLALGVGLLTTGRRRLLATRGPWLALLLAGVLLSPDLAWQAAHSFPSYEMSRELGEDNGGTGAAVAFLPLVVLTGGIVCAPVWVRGLLTCWRDRGGLRAATVAWLLLVVGFVVTGGKPYYVAGLLPLLVARGAVGIRRPTRAAAVIAVLGLATAWLSLPLLPPSLTGRLGLQNVNYDLGEQDLWPSYTAQVRRVVDTLTPAQRSGAVIVTGNYGEAGALARYGRDLPHAYSGHVSYADFGRPRGRSAAVVVVGIRADSLGADFARCRQAATITDPHGIDGEEVGRPVLVCTGQRADWSVLWPRFRHDS